MKDTNYAFCVARIRALEGRLLSGQDIAALLNQKDFYSAIAYLTAKGYTCNDANIDTIIRTESNKLSNILEECAPDSKELETLYILNDYFNLKALVKCIIESKNPSDSFVYPTSVRLSKKKSASPEDFFSALSEEHHKTAKEAYDYTIKSGNGRYCDIIIDKAAITKLASLYKGRKNGLCGEIAAFLADTANIKTALRCISTSQNSDFISEAIGDCCKLDKQKLVRCAVAGLDELYAYIYTTDYRQCAEIYKNRPSDYEKWCDDEIITMIKKAVYTSFGFDPVVSYYYRKAFEIKTVRIILTALKSDIDRQMIKERLRSIYA